LRARALAEKGIQFLGVGVSGGEEGARHGPSIMPGGPKEAYERVRPILEAAAAKVNGDPCVIWLGPGSAGHFVKMVHNGIEYGLMAAYSEGLNILKHANAGKQGRSVDAETSPLRNPEHYQYDLSLADIAEVWRRGSVVASWLLDLTAIALTENPNLENFSGHVSDSGEGRWTIMAAIEESAPAPVLSSALYERFASRGEDDFADKLLSAMRYQFGGHIEKGVGG
jgi:6-phosphogluconate dehydrogenase